MFFEQGLLVGGWGTQKGKEAKYSSRILPRLFTKPKVCLFQNNNKKKVTNQPHKSKKKKERKKERKKEKQKERKRKKLKKKQRQKARKR